MNKKMIMTSLTLGLIAASSAALIGLTNLITRKQISANADKKINAGIVDIYGKNASISQKSSIKDVEDNAKYKYVEYVYDVQDENDIRLGYAFQTTGSNMYGKVSLIVGFSLETSKFKGLSIVINEQTYASTLVNNYIIPLNNGNRELSDVSCGATYGATLVKDMVNEANEAFNKLNERVNDE